MSYAKMGELLTNQGINVIMSTVALFHDVQEYNRKNNKNYYEILVEAEDQILEIRHGKDTSNKSEKTRWKELSHEFPKNPEIVLKNNTKNQISENVEKILKLANMERKLI